MTYISSILDANPTLYVDEIQEQLLHARDVEVSIATISHAMRRLAMSHKWIAKEAAERDELVCATWQVEYGDILMEAFLWLDESGVDDRTNQCHEGWAPVGHACVH